MLPIYLIEPCNLGFTLVEVVHGNTLVATSFKLISDKILEWSSYWRWPQLLWYRGVNNLFKVSSEPWSPNSKLKLSSPQVSIPWVERPVPVDTPCCPGGLALWMLSLTFMALSSSSGTSSEIWRVLGPQSRDRRTADSAVVLIPVRLQRIPAPESPRAVQPWLQGHSATR